MTIHSGQLSLAIPLWVQVSSAWPSLHGYQPEGFRDKVLVIERYINSAVYFTLFKLLIIIIIIIGNFFRGFKK